MCRTMVAVFAMLIVVITAEEEQTSEVNKSKVLVLTESNFQETIDNTEIVLVEFCEHHCNA